MADHVSNLPKTFKEFFATPSDETKEFSRPGGFKGLSVAPYYLVKRLTERFGMCGQGWKVYHYETKVLPLHDGRIAVYVLLSLWWREKDGKEWSEWYEVGPHYGGDIAVDFYKPERQIQNKDESWKTVEIDDEAFKKAYTDAFSKCCSWIGLGGDIHDGLKDGNKYTATKPWDVSPEESIKTMQEARGETKEPVKWSPEDDKAYRVLLAELRNSYHTMNLFDEYEAFVEQATKTKADHPASRVLPRLKSNAEIKAKEAAEFKSVEQSR